MKLTRGSSAALISIIANILLVLLKSLLAFFTGSLSLKADAIHSSSDVLISVIVFLSLAIPRKKKTLLISKIENYVAILISIIISLSAIIVFRESFEQKILEIKMLPIAIIGSIGSIIITYFLSQYKTHVGQEIKSPSLLADGAHSKTDMFSSFAVLFGLVGCSIGLKMDTIIAAIVGVLILAVGLDIFRDGIHAIKEKGSFIDGKIAQVNKKSPEDMKEMIYYKKWIWIAGIILISTYTLSGIYYINPGEEGLITRFGKVVKENIHSGIHYHLPLPFERLSRESTKKLRRIEIGFRTREKWETEPEAYLWETQHEKGRYEKKYDEALMLTGDQNIVDMNVVIQYMMADLPQYLFKVDNPQKLIRGFAETSIRKVAATHSIEKILTEERSNVEKEIRQGLQEYLDSYNSGIKVMLVAISEIHPPIEIVSSFREVSNARQDKSRYIDEAESYMNETIPLARAEATKIIEDAYIYKTSKIKHAEGEAKRFILMLDEYSKNSDITIERIYLETMEKVLAGRRKIIVSPDNEDSYLDLRSYPALTGLE